MSRLIQALFLMTVLALSGCASLPGREPVKVNLVGIEPLSGQGMELRMAVKLRVQNPNDSAIDYDGVFLDVDVQGSGFASGVSDEKGTIPRFGEAVITVPVSVSAGAVLRQALGFAKGSAPSKVSYSMRGKIGSSLLGAVRFESSGQVDLPAGMLGAPVGR
jgi:LEA14-like dessication related protein